jgi:hypothetical protein
MGVPTTARRILIACANAQPTQLDVAPWSYLLDVLLQRELGRKPDVRTEERTSGEVLALVVRVRMVALAVSTLEHVGAQHGRSLANLRPAYND